MIVGFPRMQGPGLAERGKEASRGADETPYPAFPQQSVLTSELRTSSKDKPIIWKFPLSFPKPLMAFSCPWLLLTPSAGELSCPHPPPQTQPVKG